MSHATAEVSDLGRFNLGPAPGREGCGLAELVGAWSPFGLAVMRSGHLDQELRLVLDLPALEVGAGVSEDGPRYVAWVATPALDRIEALGTVAPGEPFAAPVHWNKIVIVVSREDGPPRGRRAALERPGRAARTVTQRASGEPDGPLDLPARGDVAG